MATASILLRHLLWALLSVLAMSKGSGNVSREEYLKMKSYLRFINRPAVKSIQTDDGDIFDCVDIYKQPALDHPSLQNHTIQVECDECAPHVTGFGLPSGGCPPQTVPIRRVQMEDLLRAGSVSKFQSKVTADQYVHKYAAMQTYGSYYGTEATFGLWNPTVPTAEDFSLSQLWLGAHSDANTSTMEAGWQVYPWRNGNSTKSRFFVYWTADNYNMTGCYDHTCSGFVQVSSSISPGMVLDPVSTVGGTQYDIRFYVHKDTANNAWNLKFGQSNHLIGYWPINLFSAGFAATDKVTWGGETYFTAQTTYPPMGSGRFASEGQGRAADIKNIKLLTQTSIVDVPSTVYYYQCSGCYSLDDRGNAADGSGRKFFYGGPGGTACTCLTTQASEPLIQVA